MHLPTVPARYLAMWLAILVFTPLTGVSVSISSALAAVDTDSVSATLTPSAQVRRNGENQKLGYLKISAPGTYMATLSANIRDDSVDPIQMASISLMCKERTKTLDKLGTAANIFRGETFPLTVRVYFTIKERGACFGYGATMTLRGSSASLSRRAVRATALLTVAGPVSATTVESRRFINDDPSRDRYAHRSFLAHPHQQTHAAALTTSAAPGSSALLTGSAYLTSCVSDGGSRDASTGGRELCVPSVIKHGQDGSLIRVRLVARQYAADGGACATTVVPGTTRRLRISARRHHLPVSLQGNVTLPSNARCTERVSTWIELTVLSGPAVVVHFPNTVTALRPR